MNENDATPPHDADEAGVAPYQPQLISGKWVMIAVMAISFLGAAFGWLWNYDAQRRPRDFWGVITWKLTRLAPVVNAELLVPERPTADGKPHPADYAGLIVVHYDPGESGRYVIEQTKRVENEPGLSIERQSASLREALASHRSYNWDSKAATLQRPTWCYALAFTELTDDDVTKKQQEQPGMPVTNPTATLLFDADCRFVRVPSVDKPIVLQSSVAEQFKKFFDLQFGGAANAAPTPIPSASPQNP